MSQPHILMCPPKYYGIEYEINPWMSRVRQADHDVAVRQWNDLVELLEKVGNRPRRLYLDFQNSYIEPRYRSPIPIEDGLLKQVRTGQFSPDTVRVVLDIESISDYKIFSLPDPFRVVIDVRGKEKKLEFETVAPLSPPPAPPTCTQ